MNARYRVESLHVFPLKSARGRSVLSARVERQGLADDRRMMAVDPAGKGITARVAPRLMQIRVDRDGSEVILFSPDRPPIAFDLSRLRPFAGPVSVWSSTVTAQDAGDAVAEWLSRHLQRPCRLAVQDDRGVRPLTLGSGGIVSLADTAPLLLANTGSLADLNRYLDPPAEMDRFRPNLVVSGPAAFDEDAWGRVRIGEIVFEVAGACDRCVMVTLDPATGTGRPDHQPLALLGKQRRGEDGQVYFGQFLIPQNTGRLYVGDEVDVLSRKAPIVIRPATAKPIERLPSAGIPIISGGKREKLLTCVGITDEAHDLRTFRFTSDEPFSYLPGQFITILPEIDGKPVRRNYTLSSSPSRPLDVSITVKRAEDGYISHWLHDRLKVGDGIRALGPNGRFHLRAAGNARKLLFLSAGSGVTPMMSMLRFVVDAGLDRDIVFHHSVRAARDMPFVDELRWFSKQLGPRLRVSWNFTGAPDETLADGVVHHGRLAAAMIGDVCPDFRERTVFCCGPTGFRNAARALHRAWQPAPTGPFLEESFGADPDEAEPAPIGDYTVVFSRSGKVATGTGAVTLLELARREGIALAADCEAGICGTCRCRVTSGEWRIAPNAADREQSVLSDEEKQQGYVLACSTNPVGKVEIAL